MRVFDSNILIYHLKFAFDWDAGNRDTCQHHGLTLDEIEAFFRQGRLSIAPALQKWPHRGDRFLNRYRAVLLQNRKAYYSDYHWL